MRALRLGDHLVDQPHQAGRLAGRSQLLGLGPAARLQHGLHDQILDHGLIAGRAHGRWWHLLVGHVAGHRTVDLALSGVFDAGLQLQAPRDRLPAGPDQADRVPRQRAQLAVQLQAGGHAGRDKQLFVGHAQWDHVVGKGLAQRQQLEGLARHIEPQHLHLHHAGHPRQGAVQLIVRQQHAPHQFRRAGAQQVGVLLDQGPDRGFIQDVQLQQGLAQAHDGLAVLGLNGHHEQGQAVRIGTGCRAICARNGQRRGQRHRDFFHFSGHAGMARL